MRRAVGPAHRLRDHVVFRELKSSAAVVVVDAVLYPTLLGEAVPCPVRDEDSSTAWSGGRSADPIGAPTAGHPVLLIGPRLAGPEGWTARKVTARRGRIRSREFQTVHVGQLTPSGVERLQKCLDKLSMARVVCRNTRNRLFSQFDARARTG